MSAYPEFTHTDPSCLLKKDFVPSTEVRWCPGCADYSILSQVQKLLPSLGTPKENFVFVSGIGCSSRFPYYMNTYGIHSIHGRAPAIATGLKLSRPDLSVWVVTGDGDALAIGGNHLLHALRRNIGLKILLFDNRIYGLTKGQLSPTSEFGKKTKSTPIGSVDYPVTPASFALGAGATFVGRALATDGAGLGEVLRRAAAHDGTALVVIYQNCVIFNDGAFDVLSDAETRDEAVLRVEQGKPLLFGKNKEKGIAIDGSGRPIVVDVTKGGMERVLVHDEEADTLGFILSRLHYPEFPTPFGVLHAVERPSYETMFTGQIEQAKASKKGSVQSLLESGRTWEVG